MYFLVAANTRLSYMPKLLVPGITAVDTLPSWFDSVAVLYVSPVVIFVLMPTAVVPVNSLTPVKVVLVLVP